MHNISKIISQFIAINIFIILFLVPILYALPSVKEFKMMCENNNEMLQFSKLNLMLAKSGTEDKCQWLSRFDEEYNSPLVYAIESGKLLLAKIIIEYSIRVGVNYNKFTKKDGTSMLTIVAQQCNYESVVFLIRYDHPLKMDVGETFSSPLHEAAKQKNTLIFCTLLEKYKDNKLIHHQDSKNLTPINYLIEQQKEPLTVAVLQLFPVKLSEVPKDSHNMTYLHHAVYNKMPQLTTELLIEGLDPKQVSDIGSAIEIAEKNQCTNISNLINEYSFNQKKTKVKKNIFLLSKIFSCCIKSYSEYEPIQ